VLPQLLPQVHYHHQPWLLWAVLLCWVDWPEAEALLEVLPVEPPQEQPQEPQPEQPQLLWFNPHQAVAQ
jgi:hypothetical protein